MLELQDTKRISFRSNWKFNHLPESSGKINQGLYNKNQVIPERHTVKQKLILEFTRKFWQNNEPKSRHGDAPW